MSKISLQAVSKSYGANEVLRDLSLTVEEGEFVTVLGPSGAGKSTVLNMISGLAFPTRGEILVNGQDVTSLPAEKRNIGVVFLNYALFPHLTVAQNIAFPLRVRKLTNATIASKVGRVLELVRLSGYEKRMPSELSGGQQQRIALARALVFEPSMLLLDEPLGALDTQLREQVRLDLLALQRDLNITTLLVTHDQEEALTLSDRIAVLKSGKVAQFGTPEELYEAPATPFVAQFLGSVNLLPGLPWQSGDDVRGAVKNLDLPAAHIHRDANTETGVQIVLRPENLLLTGAESEGAILTGAVRNTVYMGGRTRVFVEVGLDEPVLVDVNSAQKHARSGDRVGIKQLPGSTTALLPLSREFSQTTYIDVIETQNQR